jgi:hypothetical protein
MDRPPSWQGRPLPDPDEPVFDQGLAFDVQTIMDRRRALKLIGVATVGAAVLASPLRALAQSARPHASTSPEATEGLVIEEETAGPYPGDGSNGPDVLAQSGVVRRDIRGGFGSATGVAEGIPLTIRFLLQDAANDCLPLAGGAVMETSDLVYATSGYGRASGTSVASASRPTTSSATTGVSTSWARSRETWRMA